MDAGSSNNTAPGPLLSANHTTNRFAIDCAERFLRCFSTLTQ